jgi:hypothetical protein
VWRVSVVFRAFKVVVHCISVRQNWFWEMRKLCGNNIRHRNDKEERRGEKSRSWHNLRKRKMKK